MTFLASSNVFMYYFLHEWKGVDTCMKCYSFIATMQPKEACDACNRYLINIFGITTDEKVLLKSMTFCVICPCDL